MIYSPLSIHSVLSLIAARKNNPRFLSFLKPKSIDDLKSLSYNFVTSVLTYSASRGGPRLNFTNGLWVDQSVPPEESNKKVVLDSYKAALNEVDFKTDPEEVRIEVNVWVEKETKWLIPEILPPGSVNSWASIIFANALYFKATWDDKYFYEAPDSKDHKFHFMNRDLNKGVSFMLSRRCHSVTAFDDFKVLKVPYRDCAVEDFDNGTYEVNPRSFSMLWLLPNAKDVLLALAERVCSDPGFLDRHLNYQNFMSVTVKKFLIPMFKISSRFEASDVLKKSGLGDDCDLMRIVHKSVIEVDENGTTATVATCAQLWLCDGDFSNPKEIEEFVADHPFMFLIRENVTRTVLFIGQALNPLEG